MTKKQTSNGATEPEAKADRGQGDNLEKSVKACVREIEDLDEQLASAKSDYMLEAKELRERKKETYALAKDLGVNTRAAKTVVKIRKLQRRTQEEIAGLETEVHDAYDQYQKMVGDWGSTPLGQTAAEQNPLAAG